jgi:hypothetical protein
MNWSSRNRPFQLTDQPPKIVPYLRALIIEKSAVFLGFPNGQSHVRVMNIDLSDDEATALVKELDAIIRNDRYPLSPRIEMLKAILVKLRPEPVREPLPPPKVRSARRPISSRPM